MCLGLRVERAIKVGLVGLEETLATHWVLIIVRVDAASGEDSNVNSSLEAAVGQIQGTDNVVSDGVLFVVLAPIDIWSSSRSSSVEDVGWLDSVELSGNCLSVLHADGGAVHLLS